MTQEELEQRITDMIDREGVQNAILNFEIDRLKKAVKQSENVSGFPEGTAGRTTH